MNVLDRIAAQVRARLVEERAAEPIAKLQARTTREPRDFSKAFTGASPRVIAEVKLASPSEGVIAPGADPIEIAADYLSNGAAALSVLTERDSFHGKPEYLRQIRARNPDAYLLMKDFLLAGEDGNYQLSRARADGADAVLIIVALLGPEDSARMHEQAISRGLTPLVEVHDSDEFRIAAGFGARLIGVNNRNLKTLGVSLDVSEQLAKLARELCPGAHLVAESGIRSGADVKRLSGCGYGGFLIGTSFMRSGQPGSALARLISEARA